MLAALLAMVALNAAFVTVVAWSYLVVLPTVVGGAFLLFVDGTAPSAWELLRLPMAPHWLAATVAAFLAAQVYYGYTRVLDDVRTSTVQHDEFPTLHAIVGRLAAAADVPKPDVSVVDAETPNSFTVGRGHAATVVVTEPLLALLDESELEAVLAHEIAHVRHRDVTLMTITGLFVAVAERALGSARLLGKAVTDRDELTARQRLVTTWLLPVVAFTYLFVAPVLWLFPPVARFASGELSRQREFAADRAAADVTGAPTTLARALVAVHEATPEVAKTDLRHERAALQALCVVPFGVVDADAAVADADAPAVDRSRAAAVDATTDWSAPERAAADENAAADDGSAASDDAAVADGDATVASSRDDRPTPDDLDPEAWLGTTNRDNAGARTHPPIDERVRRLVDLAEDR